MTFRQWLIGGLGSACVLLAGVIAAQLALPGPEQDAADATGIRPAPRVPATAATPASVQAADHTDAWVATILARPLFTRDRRPASERASTAATGGQDSGLPRLTGIAVSPLGRSAIFSGGENGKPIVVSEGGSVGGYTVQAIHPGAVTVTGPDGERTLAPAFDPTARRADPTDTTAGQGPGAPQPGLPQPQPGFPQAGFPQPGFPQPGFPQPGLPQPALPQPGFAQPGLQPGMPQNGLQIPGQPRSPALLQVPAPGRARQGDGALRAPTPYETGSSA